MYNVLFPSGRVLEFGTLTIATIYVKAYNGTCVGEPNGILGAITTIPHAKQINALSTLNLRPQAVQGLVLGNDEVLFSARFGGKPMGVRVPMRAVLALYAQENGRGMVFDAEEEDEQPPSSPVPSSMGRQPRAGQRVIATVHWDGSSTRWP